MERSPILTVPRVASILGISIPYAQRLLREGKIPGVKTPNGWCATQEAVEEYRAKRERKRTKKRGNKGVGC